MKEGALMFSPIIIPLERARTNAAPPSLARGAGIAHYLVTRDGEFGGRRWSVGEVLVCLGDASDGDRVVLEARGQGRPRLGTVCGTTFAGEAGEPCHPMRWRSAGRVVAVHCQRAGEWIVELLDGGRREADTQSGQHGSYTGQLSLFGGSARRAAA